MCKKGLRIYAVLFMLIGVFTLKGPLFSEEGKNTPVLHVDHISHTFSPVFEGEDLTHTFTISNRGTADLEIKKVTHS
jgi:hypothetical protein